MKIVRSADQPTQRGSGTSFTGTAWQQAIAVGDGAAPLHVTDVTFEPGARTVWHHHPHGQVLVATSGIGRFQSRGCSLVALLPGDSVAIAAGEVHWHGAAPGQLFVHTSIQAADSQAEQATWLHPVSDEEYAHDPD